MPHRFATRLSLLAVTAISTLAGAQEHQLSGKVLNTNSDPVARAVVIVCDQETGIPVASETFQPFTKDMSYQKIAFAITDEQGVFSVPSVKPRTYRLIAQSWEDATEPFKQVLEVNGRTIRLHGIAANIAVPSPAAKKVVIRPAGTATLNITTAPQAPNNETLLVLSQGELAADPILAFAAWTGPFMPQMLAGNRMPLGRTVFHGLPAGTVYLAAFAADNNPGFGGVSCELKANNTSFASIPLIASWSDGHKQHPSELAPLVKRLSSNEGPSVMELLRAQAPKLAKDVQAAKENPRSLGGELGPLLDKTIDLGDGKDVFLKDLLAAEAYVRLQEFDQDRKNKLYQQAQQKMPADTNVGYEQALKDLHSHLGRGYPCFEIKSIDWQAVGERLLPQAKDIKTDDGFGLLCLEMVAALEDSHAQLLPAAAKIPTIEFPSWDAGFACLVDDRGRPVVYYVASDSSAATAGLEIGMTVKEVNGQPAEELIGQIKQQLKKYVGYSSDRYLRYHAFRFFARQMKQGAEVELVVSDDQQSEKTLSLQAHLSPGYIPRLPAPIEGIPDSGSVSWKMLDDDIGYIYVRRIKSNLIESLDRAVKELNSANGLIIDVRGNSGGGFDSARSHRNFDLDDGSEPSRPRFTKNIAILVDARCISAGEGWTSWFIARQRARLFGETTAGASARKTTYTLSNGLFSVRYPVKAYRGFLDRPIERRGLEPDVAIMPSAKDIGRGRDTVLEAARQWLRAERE